MPKMFSTIHKSALSQQLNKNIPRPQDCAIVILLFFENGKECNGIAAVTRAAGNEMGMQQYKRKAKAPLKM